MKKDTLDDGAAGDGRGAFEDDELMKQISTPPEFPPASRDQVEQTWLAIVDQVEAQRPAPAGRVRPARSRRGRMPWLDGLFGAAPAWSWQIAKVAALVVLGFSAAWIAAGRGWLPGTATPDDLPGTAGTTGAVPDRAWLAAGDYSGRLEALLLGLTKGDAAGDELAPAAREVSRELLNDNRLYQRAAERRGDPELSALLSRMEIILLALATAPEGQEQDVINTLRQFIDESDVLGDLREVQSSVPHVPRLRAATTTGS